MAESQTAIQKVSSDEKVKRERQVSHELTNIVMVAWDGGHGGMGW